MSQQPCFNRGLFLEVRLNFRVLWDDEADPMTTVAPVKPTEKPVVPAGSSDDEKDTMDYTILIIVVVVVVVVILVIVIIVVVVKKKRAAGE